MVNDVVKTSPQFWPVLIPEIRIQMGWSVDETVRAHRECNAERLLSARGKLVAICA